VASTKISSPEKPSFFKIKVPLLAVILLLVISGVSLYFVDARNKKECEAQLAESMKKIEGVSVRILVEDEYKLIKPLAFVEFTKEDTLLLGIKNKVLDYIEEKQREGAITSASGYVRNLNHHQDVRINPSEVYFPGSLMKIPILITFLKASEREESLLNKQVTFSMPYDNLPFQNIKSSGIQLGQSYSIKQLLEYMITHSDNNATALLSENIPFEKIVHVFENLQLPYPDKTKPDYGITLKDYSRFFRVLFNASYLSWENSEFALDLLTKTDYNNGIIKGVEKGVVVAHKFGERNSDGVQQLHEVGIVYLKDRPYLIGLMTKGNDIKKMEPVLSDISKIVYTGMKEGKVD
jgi:beta-lactamase class A